MKIQKTDIVQGGRCKITRGLYRVRVIGTDFGKSSKGHAMTTLTVEIIEPETIMDGDVELKIAGRQTKIYLMHVPSEAWGQAQVFEFMDKLGIDHNNEYDTDLHKEYFLGQEFDIILDSEEDLKRYAKVPGEKEGKPILDGQGAPISNGWNIKTGLSDIPALCRPTRSELAF